MSGKAPSLILNIIMYRVNTNIKDKINSLTFISLFNLKNSIFSI